MTLYINNYIQWNQHGLRLNGNILPSPVGQDTHERALSLYQQSGISYAKFFKMDILSRVAFLCAELTGPYPEDADRTKIATVVSTGSGCISVDKKFEESRKTLASPALFVYTLPNIMLGEICIRHGFKGEQICTIEAHAHTEMTWFQVTDLLSNRGTTACLCGHVEATDNDINATLMWVSKKQEQAHALAFSTENLKRIFTNQ